MKYPFWIIKRDGLNLLKGKWNPLVLSLFIPFLIYCSLFVKMFMIEDGDFPPDVIQKLVFSFDIATMIFTLLMEILAVGIYHNLRKEKEHASFFSVYAFSFRNIFKIFPTLLLSVILPVSFSMVLSYTDPDWLYDYLFFSLMSYPVYYLVMLAVTFGVQILGMYLQYSLLFAPCILADHPEYSGFRLVKESFYLSRGKRFYLFFMTMSFVGWFFVGSMAVIGVLWAMLYLMATRYAYYHRLTNPPEIIVEFNPMQ